MTLALEIEREKRLSKKQGVFEAVLSLLKKSRITEADAAEELGITVTEFKKLIATNT